MTRKESQRGSPIFLLIRKLIWFGDRFPRGKQNSYFKYRWVYVLVMLAVFIYYGTFISGCKRAGGASHCPNEYQHQRCRWAIPYAVIGSNKEKHITQHDTGSFLGLKGIKSDFHYKQIEYYGCSDNDKCVSKMIVGYQKPSFLYIKHIHVETTMQTQYYRGHFTF